MRTHTPSEGGGFVRVRGFHPDRLRPHHAAVPHYVRLRTTDRSLCPTSAPAVLTVERCGPKPHRR